MNSMSAGALKGKWTQLKHRVKQKWNQLAEDETTQIDSDYDQMVSKLQEIYGYSRERAEREVHRTFGSPQLVR